MKYIVLDSLGNCMRVFNTYEEASNYKLAFGNRKWKISIREHLQKKQLYVTLKQSPKPQN